MGAGASKPYGFPLGSELRSEITKVSSSTKYTSSICDFGNVSPQELEKFCLAFDNSNINSIDSFLSKRVEFEKVGKAAIAVLLNAKEKINQFENIPTQDNWYFHLWNQLISGITDPNQLTQNQLKIITFNYDRSLEYFLMMSIMNTFNLREDDASNLLKSLSIIHVYGSLGKYNHSNYGKNSLPILSEAVNSIKIIPETRDNDPTFQTAQEWMFDAKNICFLGFGFDELNIKRLDLKSASIRKMDKPLVVASTFGMTEAEVNLAKKLLGIPSQNWRSVEGNSLKTIREHIYLLR